jgi:hypothetical protein
MNVKDYNGYLQITKRISFALLSLVPEVEEILAVLQIPIFLQPHSHCHQIGYVGCCKQVSHWSQLFKFIILFAIHRAPSIIGNCAAQPRVPSRTVRQSMNQHVGRIVCEFLGDILLYVQLQRVVLFIPIMLDRKLCFRHLQFIQVLFATDSRNLLLHHFEFTLPV